jgi:hypothetical protein
LEAGVMRRALLIVGCLLTAACDADPARSVKIASRPPATATTRSVAGPPGTVDPSQTGEWRAQACPPPPEDSPGPSSLVATGPCAFEHHAAVGCEATADDFIIATTRPAARGATLVIFVNVEHYAGPGRYAGAQMFVEVEDHGSIYRWSSDTLSITVGAGEKFATLPTSRLDAEPLLVNCQGEVGPGSNWLYDCAGRGSRPAMDTTTEVVSGTLWCDTKPLPLMHREP